MKLVADIQSQDEAKRVFLDWLSNFEVVDDADSLLGLLSCCEDELAGEHCDNLGIRRGSTFADAASFLGAQWGLS